MDEHIVDFAMNQLTPKARLEVERRAATEPAYAARLHAVTTLLAPLDLDREDDTPPPGLALSGIERTAQHLIANGLYSPDRGIMGFEATAFPNARYRESRWLPLLRGYANAGAVAAMVLLSIGLAVTAIQRSRQAYQQAVCQDNLRELHAGLTGYSATHDGRFPQVGTPGLPTAGDYYTELARSGQPLADSARHCPLAATDRSPASVGYAYSLGFRDPLGRLQGLRRPETAEDLTPIAADLPDSRHSGWNVLRVGGNVTFTRTTLLAARGDELFRNDAGLPAAGLHMSDISLGRPFDVP